MVARDHGVVFVGLPIPALPAPELAGREPPAYSVYLTALETFIGLQFALEDRDNKALWDNTFEGEPHTYYAGWHDTPITDVPIWIKLINPLLYHGHLRTITPQSYGESDLFEGALLMKRVPFIVAIACAAVILGLVWRNAALRPTPSVHQPRIDRDGHKGSPPLSISNGIGESHSSLPQQLSMESSAAKTGSSRDLKQLGRKLAEGDATARSDVITIAKNPSDQIEMRRTAVVMLGNDDTPQALSALFDLLSDSNKSLRGAALFALPRTKRPTDFDYTSDPAPESLLQLDREKARLLNEP